MSMKDTKLFSSKKQRVLFLLGLVLVIVAGFIVATTISSKRNPSPTKAPFVDRSHVTVHGTMACLPHTGDGPTTMECAYGLRADNGSYYGLKGNINAGDIPMEEHITVHGTFSAEKSNRYEIDGTIHVDHIDRK